MYVYYCPEGDKLWFTPEQEHPMDLPAGTVRGELLTKAVMSNEKREAIRERMRNIAAQRKACIV